MFTDRSRTESDTRRTSSARGTPQSKEARLIAILETFERGVEGVRGSAIADHEGLPIANGFREPFDLVAVAAMSTLAAQSSRTVFDHLGFKAPRAVFIEGEDAKVVVYKLGVGQASLIALVRPDTNTGLLKLEMAVAAQRLEEELGLAIPTGTRVEEVFVLAEGGLLISHASRNPNRSMDRDVVAGMFSAVQSFVKDTFREQGGGALEEMELAHLRVRLLRGRFATVAIIATGRMSDAYVAVARDALREFERRNEAALRPWDGELQSLEGVDVLLDEILQTPAN
ncbi:MAG TPA: roadblock/LC7 domain-containing protein [Thermoplasmata archaeon]|nr:roadblock/LC7 domain-containing protein [Thermoplasmata archaeon]